MQSKNFGNRKRADKSRRKTGDRPELRNIERRMGLIVPSEMMKVARNQAWIPLRAPKGPYQGAQYSTRQMASTFGSQTGFSNVGGSASPAQLIQGSAVAVYFALAFQLSDLPNSAALAALFDQYRIEKVKVHFKSRNNAVSVFNTASPNGGVPTGYAVVDRDDATALTSTTDALQYDNVICFNGEEDVSFEFVPSITPAIFSGGAFSAYTTVPSNSAWIDIANTSVPHYAIKGHLGPLSASVTSAWTWDVSAEYIVSCRKTR
jgi:hypothetical protein